MSEQQELQPAPGPRPASSPIVPADRSATLDAIRGFALLGILGPNLLTFAWPMAAMYNSKAIGPSQWNEAGHTFIMLFFQGKMMFLFAMLFGAGAWLQSRKFNPDDPSERRRGTRLWYTRSAWLLLIGFLHATLFWFGDILVWYAVAAFGLVWWAKRWSITTLLASAAGLFGLGTLFLGGLSLLGVWAVNAGHVPPDQLYGNPGQEIAAYTGGYLDGLTYRVFFLIMMWFVYMPLFLPAVTGIMLAGIAMIRTGFLTGNCSTRTYAMTAAIGIPLGVSLTVLAMTGFKAITPDHHGMLTMSFAQLLGIPTAFGYAALIAILVRFKLLTPLTSALAAVGRFALSNYLLQTVLCTFVFYGWGLGRFASIQYPWLLIVMLSVWAVNIAFSLIWKRYFRFGPAEWVWRSLTYAKPQPLR